MGENKKVVVVVIDALGADTLKNYINWTKKLPQVDFLKSLGLFNTLVGNPIVYSGRGFATRVMQTSKTASSVMGHREMIGINDQIDYKLFDKGFPPEYLDHVVKTLMEKGLRNPKGGKIGWIFNKMCGGTDAINKNYREHEETGNLIVYASMCDPLIQIAVDKTLYDKTASDLIAEVAFELSVKEGLLMERAIARPYELKNGKPQRIDQERHDKVVPINQMTLIDILQDANVPVFGIGKIPDLITPVNWDGKIPADEVKFTDNFFQVYSQESNQGSNAACLQALYQFLEKGPGFYFVNLVETDSRYGHTCKKMVDGKLVCEGTIDELGRIDKSLEYIFNNGMNAGDVLVVTADHGMKWREDTQYGYHSIEPLPLLAVRKNVQRPVSFLSPGTLSSVGYIPASEFGCAEEFEEMCIERTLIS